MSIGKVVVSGILAVLTAACATSAWSRTGRASNFEKRIRCEDRSRDLWWQCRQRALAKKGREKNKAEAICQTMFATSMERCRRYE